MHSTELKLVVPFHDVDPMNIVWHGNYAKYFELVRCKLLESIAYNYNDMFDSGYSWPVVDMRIKYVKPARFDQEVVITAHVVEWEYRLKVKYIIQDAKTGEKLTKGETTQVAVDLDKNEMCFETPEIFRQKLGVSE